ISKERIRNDQLLFRAADAFSHALCPPRCHCPAFVELLPSIIPPRLLLGVPAGTLTEPIVLELVHLSRRFGDTLAVDDANLRIEAGEMTGVIGRSGAGQPTLLRLINPP